MFRTNSNPRTRISLGIAALILLGIVALSYREWREYSRANIAATQTQNTIDAVEQLLSSVTDAETGQRGFLLTGENRYLQAYNSAVQAIPTEVAALKDWLSARPEQSGNWVRLNSLVDQRLAALREAIQQRQARDVVSTSALDEGKRRMDEVRALCVQIERDESSHARQASLAGEAASATALLTTVVAALALFFLFTMGQAPAISAGSQRRLMPWPIRYGVAILAAAGAVTLRLALSPLIGPIELGFSIPLAAVLFSAWFGGLGCGAVCTLLSGFSSAYYFAEPGLLSNRSDQISLLIFVVLGFGISVLADSQRRAVERAVRAENAERVERQRFETTLTSIGDAVIATDARGRVTFANRTAVSLLRWPEADIPGQPLGNIFRIVNEYSRATVDSPVERVLREGGIVGLANHTLMIARDGTEVPIDDSAAPIRDPTGSIQGTVLVFRDISERRRAEAAGSLLASIVESSEDAILSEDRESLITSWNKGAERMFGFSAAEIIGRPVSILSPSDRAGEVRAIRERIRRDESIEQFQTVCQTKNGKRIHASITISPLRDAAGRISGASKIIRDITPQVESQAELAEHRERLATILQHLPVGVAVIDTAGQVVIGNPFWSRFLPSGIPLLHQNAGWHAVTGGQPFPPNGSPVMRALDGEQVLPGVDFLYTNDAGAERWMRMSAVPWSESDGRITGALTLLQDIDEERRAEERRAELLAKETALNAERALRETEAELARVLRALSVGELATSIAHEINQPLAGVVTNAEAALRWLSAEAPDVAEARQSIALISRDANRASAVIRRIREFLRNELPQTAPLNLRDLVLEVVALADAELRKRNILVHIDLPHDLPPVRGDRIQLQQVILNLVLNAAEAMAGAATPKELRVTSERSADRLVVIAVRDSGVGINPENLSHMFEAFYTTKAAGMGMGLSISRSIVEAHGGRIWATRNDGPGLTVRFGVPAEASSRTAGGAS